MALDDVQVAPEGAGPKIDGRSFPRGGDTINQQTVSLGDGTDGATVETATAAPAGGARGLVVRTIPSGNQSVTDATVAGSLGMIDGTLSNIHADVETLQTQLPAALAVGGGLKVEGVAGGTAVPVSASALPLPAGAATQATIASILTALGATLTVNANGSTVAISGTVPVSAAALPLPAGAATQTTLAAVLSALGATLAVDASGHSLTIGGTVAVSALALPLPAGAATEATLAAISGKLPAALGGAGGVKVEIVAGGGGGSGNVEYTEGDTDATITGQAMLWEDTADTLRAVSAAKPLPVGDGGGSLTVDGTVAVSGTVPVSAAALPLPAGAATEATLAAASGKLPAALAAGGGMKVEGVAGGVAQPISAASLPLPAGASTEATSTAISSKLPAALGGAGGLKVEVVAGGGSSNVEYTEGDTDATITGQAMLWEDAADTLRAVSAAKPLPVGDGGGSLTVDGTVAVSGTVPVSAASLPLPTGAATETTLAAASAKLPAALVGGRLDVQVGAALPAGANAIGKLAANAGVNIGTVAVSAVSGNVAITAAALPLPAGAATEATLANIKTGTDKIPTISTEDAASAADPVGYATLARRRDTLTAAEVSADGDVIALNATSKGEVYVKQTDAVPVTDNGGSITVDGTVAVSGTVPVSAASLPLPAGAATEATLAGIKTGTDKIPASPATDRTTAAAPGSARLSDGAAFYDAAKTGQLPAALAAGGGLKVEGIAGGVAQPVSIATAVPVTDNAGSLTVDSGQLPAALAAGGGIKIEGVAGGVVVPISDGAGSITVDGTVAVSSAPASARTTDSVAAAMQTDAIMSGLTALTPKFAVVNATASADLIALVSSKKLRVLAMMLNSNIDGTVNLQTGGTTSLTGVMTLRGGGGFVLPFNPLGWFETASGAKLNAVLATITQLSGVIVYAEV